MAAILLSCFGIAASKLSAKRRAKKEREQEYGDNFEVLKEENAKRVRQLSNQGSTDSTLYGDAVVDRSPEMQQAQNGVASVNGPPKYDDIVEQRERTGPRVSGSG